MPVLLVTLCTNRKRYPPPEDLQARTLKAGTYAEVVQEWSRRVQTSEAVRPAWKLYCGRGFTEALETATLTSHSLWILSAGMGLITAEDHIPAYDLTLAGTSTNSIRPKIAPGPFRAD